MLTCAPSDWTVAERVLGELTAIATTPEHEQDTRFLIADDELVESLREWGYDTFVERLERYLCRRREIRNQRW